MKAVFRPSSNFEYQCLAGFRMFQGRESTYQIGIFNGTYLIPEPYFSAMNFLGNEGWKRENRLLQWSKIGPRIKSPRCDQSHQPWRGHKPRENERESGHQEKFVVVVAPKDYVLRLGTNMLSKLVELAHTQYVEWERNTVIGALDPVEQPRKISSLISCVPSSCVSVPSVRFDGMLLNFVMPSDFAESQDKWWFTPFGTWKRGVWSSHALITKHEHEEKCTI